MSEKIVITGGTGFVGTHLILELLEQSDAELFCLVRAKNTSAEQRLHQQLAQVTQGSGYAPELINQVKKRCHAIEADLQGDITSLAASIPRGVSQFWHCAASLNYEERFAAEIYDINVEGTRKALALARALNVDCFNYVSTAYVAGRNTGVILESPMAEVQSSNVYESSKVEAEQLIYAQQDMKYRIFRPSIVIGHSRTYHAINFSGMYGFLRRLIQFKGMMARVQRGYLEREPICMNVDPDVPINFVPVDKVAKQAVAIARSDSNNSIFHLTNRTVPTVGEALEVLFSTAGLPPPKIVQDTTQYAWIDEKFNEKIEFYKSYLTGYKQFDRSASNAALGEHANTTRYAVTANNLNEYCGWYCAQLAQTRSQVPVSR